jgi:hypothetical protein
MAYRQKEFTMRNTTDGEIAVALAELAGFPNITQHRITSSAYRITNASSVAVVFHDDDHERAKGDTAELMATGPRIMVGNYLKDKNFKRTKRFLIEYDSNLVPDFSEEELVRTIRNIKRNRKRITS